MEKLKSPMGEQMDFDDIGDDLGSFSDIKPEYYDIRDVVEREVRKFFERMGFRYEDFVRRYSVNEEDKVIKVYVDIDRLEKIPLLKGGKFLTILQQIAGKFAPMLNEKEYSWLFIRVDNKRASAEMGILNEALARLGDDVVQKGGIEALLTYDMVRQLANIMNTNTEAMKRQLEKELAQSGNILAI